MSRQIAVRLPDDVVEFIDQLVAAGASRSRAGVVAEALRREQRRTIAARDAAILAASGADADMDGLAEYAARTPMDDLE
ncbi:MAG: ribbon-helix-helix protein, CopG family [Candidatus Dormibacteraeota bacterium]|nr:ribbon-helix-helix protein, CopG family [Candidatus Dormibacteraeota bacterium]